MPDAPLRPCLGNCGARVKSGRCPACSRIVEQRRGSASQRGYGTSWEAFRLQFMSLLVQAGIAPVCGAALPDGPRTQDSQCQQQGVVNGDRLHLDHEPPLQEWERRIISRICDPSRVQFLCATCHSAKTRREQTGGEGKSLRATPPETDRKSVV